MTELIKNITNCFFCGKELLMNNSVEGIDLSCNCSYRTSIRIGYKYYSNPIPSYEEVIYFEYKENYIYLCNSKNYNHFYISIGTRIGGKLIYQRSTNYLLNKQNLLDNIGKVIRIIDFNFLF